MTTFHTEVYIFSILANVVRRSFRRIQKSFNRPRSQSSVERPAKGEDKGSLTSVYQYKILSVFVADKSEEPLAEEKDECEAKEQKNDENDETKDNEKETKEDVEGDKEQTDQTKDDETKDSDKPEADQAAAKEGAGDKEDELNVKATMENTTDTSELHVHVPQFCKPLF